MDAINNATVGVEAAVNDARNGLVLRDTTGATTGNLIVANADATNTADRLGVAVDAAQNERRQRFAALQVFHEGVRLDTLNNGQGVRLGSFLITDSLGASSGVNLRTVEAKTVGDVLDLINGLGLAVEARINDTGDGILLVDTGAWQRYPGSARVRHRYRRGRPEDPGTSQTVDSRRARPLKSSTGRPPPS